MRESYPFLTLSISAYTPSNPTPSAEALIAAVICRANPDDLSAVVAHYGADRVTTMVNELDRMPLAEGWGGHLRCRDIELHAARLRKVSLTALEPLIGEIPYCGN